MKIRIFLKNYKIELIIFLLALILRLIIFYIAAYQNNFVFTNFLADGYYELSHNLVNHHIFSGVMDGYLKPESLRAPGLPIIIAPFLYFFQSVFGFIILQIIAGSFLPLISRQIALNLQLSARLANLVGFFMVFEPLGLSLSTLVLTETFFTFFFLLFILYLIKFLRFMKTTEPSALKKYHYQEIILSGAFLSLATLIKPTTIYLPFILVIFWLVYRYFLKQVFFWKLIFIFIIFSNLFLPPWFYRNYNVSGVFGYTSAKAWVMYWALAPSILTYKNKQSFDQAQKEFFASSGLVNPPDYNLENSAWLVKQASKIIFAHPLYLAESALVSVYTFFTHDGAYSLISLLGLKTDFSRFKHGLGFFNQSGAEIFGSIIKMLPTPMIMILIARIFWVFISLAFLASAIYQLIRKKINLFSGFLLTIILYFAATTTLNGLGVNARFRFPVNSLIIIYIFIGWSIFKDSHRISLNN